MSSKAHVKKGDTVVVIAGDHRGERGKILEVDREKQRVKVEGVNVRRKALRRSQQHPEGGFVDLEGGIALSNVMKEERYEARQTARAAGK